MKRINSRVGVTAAVIVITLATAIGVVGASHTSPTASAQLIDTNGARVGTVSFRIVNGKMSATANILFPKQFAGFHGFHLHRLGTCDPKAIDTTTGQPSAFYSAGGHIGSEDGHAHGVHDGDLPPLLVNRDGSASLTVLTDHISFDRLFDADGTAVIIHLGKDNLANIPARYAANGPDAATLATGDAGSRTACGVVKR